MMSPFTGTDVTCRAGLEKRAGECQSEHEGGAASQSGDSSQGIAAGFTVGKNKYDLSVDFFKKRSFYSYSNECLKEHLWVIK